MLKLLHCKYTVYWEYNTLSMQAKAMCKSCPLVRLVYLHYLFAFFTFPFSRGRVVVLNQLNSSGRRERRGERGWGNGNPRGREWFVFNPQTRNRPCLEILAFLARCHTHTNTRTHLHTYIHAYTSVYGDIPAQFHAHTHRHQHGYALIDWSLLSIRGTNGLMVTVTWP